MARIHRLHQQHYALERVHVKREDRQPYQRPLRKVAYRDRLRLAMLLQHRHHIAGVQRSGRLFCAGIHLRKDGSRAAPRIVSGSRRLRQILPPGLQISSRASFSRRHLASPFAKICAANRWISFLPPAAVRASPHLRLQPVEALVALFFLAPLAGQQTLGFKPAQQRIERAFVDHQAVVRQRLAQRCSRSAPRATEPAPPQSGSRAAARAARNRKWPHQSTVVLRSQHAYCMKYTVYQTE